MVRRRLAELYPLTIVIITHDTDRVAVLGEGKVVGVGSISELAHMEHPDIRVYFDGPRGRAALAQAQAQDKIKPTHKQDKEQRWTQK